LRIDMNEETTVDFVEYLFDRLYLYRSTNPRKAKAILKEINDIKKRLEEEGKDTEKMFSRITSNSKMSHKKEKVYAYVDGASRNSHNNKKENKSSIAFAIYDSNKLVFEDYKRIDSTTSVVAEYKALIASLRRLLRDGYRKRKVTVFSDYKPIVNQLKMIYKASKPELVALRDEARSLIERFSFIDVKYISRESNAYADMLANKALDEGSKNHGRRQRAS